MTEKEETERLMQVYFKVAKFASDLMMEEGFALKDLCTIGLYLAVGAAKDSIQRDPSPERCANRVKYLMNGLMDIAAQAELIDGFEVREVKPPSDKPTLTVLN